MGLRDTIFGVPAFDADGGGAGGGAAAGGAQGQQTQGAQGQQSAGSALELAQKIVADAAASQPGGAQGSDPQGQTPMQGNRYRPEGLPDELAGASDKETLDKLYGAYKPLQAAFAQRGEVPKAPDGYKLEIADAAARKALFGDADPAKDPALKIWADVAHELGFSQKEFNALGRFAELATKAGVLGGATIDPKAEIEALADELKGTEADPVKRTAEGAKRMVVVNTWLQGLQQRNVLTQAERETMAAISGSAHGVRILEKLSRLGGGGGVQNPGGGSGAGESQQTEHEKAMRAMFPSMQPA